MVKPNHLPIASLVSTPFRAQVEGILWTWLFQKSSSSRCLARKVHTLFLLNVWLKRLLGFEFETKLVVLYLGLNSMLKNRFSGVLKAFRNCCSYLSLPSNLPLFLVLYVIYPLRCFSSRNAPPFFLRGKASSLMAASATSSREAAPPEGLSA